MELKPTTWEDIDQYSIKDIKDAFGDFILLEAWQSYWEGSELLGSFFISPRNCTGVIVHPDHRGQGVLEKMYATQDRKVLYADIESTNIQSIKAHKKIGFTKKPNTAVTYMRKRNDN